MYGMYIKKYTVAISKNKNIDTIKVEVKNAILKDIVSPK